LSIAMQHQLMSGKHEARELELVSRHLEVDEVEEVKRKIEAEGFVLRDHSPGCQEYFFERSAGGTGSPAKGGATPA
jgi:hypothetical protein